MPDWLSFSVVKNILLSAVAFYGAVLSTFNYIQAARKERRFPGRFEGHVAMPSVGMNLLT
jgi:hypothetical protein